MLRGASACMRASRRASSPFSSSTPYTHTPFVPTIIRSSVRFYSNQQQPEEKPKQTLYSTERTGPSLDFKDDFIGDKINERGNERIERMERVDRASEVTPTEQDKWAGVEAIGFRKKYLHEVVSKELESLRHHLNSITDRVISKSIGGTKEDKIMLRKLATMLDRAEVEMQSHQNVWRKAAKPKRKTPWGAVIMFSCLLLLVVIEYERYLDHQGPSSLYDVIIPYRYGSHLWGKLANTQLPTFLRTPVYRLYASIFGCNLNEMGLPLESYPSLGDFFARPLKPGARVWANDGMASPVDGVVVSCGALHKETIEQVKGLTYTLTEFLQPNSPIPAAAHDPARQFYQVTLYLAPGDYHRIHAPVDYVLDNRRIIPGRLVSVSQRMVSTVRGLFATNERVVLEGRWAHGLFAEVLVGAYNVGSITLPFDETAATNVREHAKNRDTKSYEKSYKADPLLFQRGTEVGQFHMGSTVVLIFEAPAHQPFEFNLTAGQRVRLGQKIGDFRSNLR